MKKNFFLVTILSLILFVFFACSGSDQMTLVNESLIRNQLAQISVPSAQEINVKLSNSPSSLKKIGSSEISSQRVLLLDKEYFEVTEFYATRYLQSYEIADGGRIKRQIQIAQTFPMKDGILVDTIGWSVRVDLEGVGIRRCTLWFAEYISQITVFFHKNDGLQLAYNANLYDGALYLPPLSDGTWQIQVDTYNKGVYQTFVTIPYQIKQSDPQELFLIYDDIFQMTDPKENTVAIATVSAQSLQGNYLFVCEDENRNCFSQPIPATISSETISFAIPFKPKNIYVWGWNGWETEIDPGVEPGVDGIYHYNL